MSHSFFLYSYFSASSRMTDGQSERLCINPTISESAEGRNGDRVFFLRVGAIKNEVPLEGHLQKFSHYAFPSATVITARKQ